MSITKYVPVLAYLGGNFTSGPATGTPRQVEPAAGDQGNGFVPGDDADAQVPNFYLGSLGAHLEYAVDAPAFQWTPLTSFSSAELQNGTFNPNGNPNGQHDPPLFHASSEGYLFAQGYKNGTNHYTTFRSKFGKGFQFFSVATDDQYVGNQICDDMENTLSANANEIPGTDGRVITHAGLASMQVGRFVYIGTGTNALKYQYSTDRGLTYSALGNIATALSGSELYMAFQALGAWYVGVKTGPGPFSTQFYKSSSLDLSTATWASSFACSNAAAAQDFVGRRSAASSTRVVIVPEFDNTVTAWDGTTRTNIAIAAHDGTKTNWRVSYNANIGLFGLVNLQGDFWTSPDGLSWTHVAQYFVSGQGFYDIKAYGRGFMVVTGTNGSYVYYMAQDHTQTWVQQLVLEPYTESTYPSAFHLVRSRGRVYAVKTGNDGTVWRLEWYRSDVHPLDRNVT